MLLLQWCSAVMRRVAAHGTMLHAAAASSVRSNNASAAGSSSEAEKSSGDDAKGRDLYEGSRTDRSPLPSPVPGLRAGDSPVSTSHAVSLHSARVGPADGALANTRRRATTRGCRRTLILYSTTLPRPHSTLVSQSGHACCLGGLLDCMAGATCMVRSMRHLHTLRRVRAEGSHRSQRWEACRKSRRQAILIVGCRAHMRVCHLCMPSAPYQAAASKDHPACK
jgi:hypothetical protein